MKAHKNISAAIFVMALLMFTAASGADRTAWFVAPGGDDAHHGKDWTAPFKTISNAVGRSGAGDCIVVSNGTYTVTAPIEFGDRVIASVNGPHVTIIGGGGATRCVTMTHTNSYLDGFSVINGMAGTGGGIHISGGGVITNCRISGNVSTSTVSSYNDGGGGVAVAAGGARILNCWIYGNRAANGGGGVRVIGGATRLLICDTTIEGNTSGAASYAGGGISSYGGSSGGLRLVNCLLLNNLSHGQGGGISWTYGAVEFEDCRFIGNTGAAGGGAMRLYMPGTVLLKNSLVALNRLGAGGHPGGGVSLYLNGGVALFDNCTIVDNSAGTGPGGGLNLAGVKGDVKISNTICYHNHGAPVSSNIALAAGIKAVLANSCTAPSGELAGENLIFTDPGMADWRRGVYRLSATAPGRGMGADAPWLDMTYECWH